MDETSSWEKAWTSAVRRSHKGKGLSREDYRLLIQAAQWPLKSLSFG